MRKSKTKKKRNKALKKKNTHGMCRKISNKIKEKKKQVIMLQSGAIDFVIPASELSWL